MMSHDNRRQVLMAFDYGSRRVGVALALPAEPPQPLTTLERDSGFARALKNLIAKHRPDIIIVGRPRNLDGEMTAQTHRAEQFARQLRSDYDIKVVLSDEALSTERARERLSGMSRQAEKRLLDQIAAQIILEDYLNETK